MQDPSTDDDSDDYAHNRKNAENKYCRKIDVERFSPDNKEQDFAIWVLQFEDAVKRALNPHSRRRHYKACMVWLSGALKADAYSIWSRASNRNGNWLLLKAELELAFEDGSVRSEWKTNLKAYTWDEHSQSLQCYCAKVKSMVDKYEKEMADCPAAKKAQYFLRFLSGLPDDYVQHVKLSMPPHSTDVDKARDLCLQWQSCKRLKRKSEVGASGTFQEPTMSSRITQNENEIARLYEDLEQLQTNHW